MCKCIYDIPVKSRGVEQFNYFAPTCFYCFIIFFWVKKNTFVENHDLVYPEDGGSRFVPIWQISTVTHGATSQRIFTTAVNIKPNITISKCCHCLSNR
jgi:hypothetical protein